MGSVGYHLEERRKDFARAWLDVVRRYAIQHKVDFMLIAGDFFDKPNIEPQAMNQAMAGLKLLKDAKIPVVVIEGNHDKHPNISPFQQEANARTHSWLRSLCDWEFIYLLEPTVDQEGNVTLKAWNEDDRIGSYIDIADARIFGSYWYGANMKYAIPILSDSLRSVRDASKFNILMLHTDIEGHVNHRLPALPVESLTELKTLVDYVALGHTHKHFVIDNWAFNPGSLEACKIDEYKEERGAFLVEVGEQKNIKATHLSDYVQRPFQRLSFDVSGAVDAETVYAGVMDVIEREANKYDPSSKNLAPIIEMTLRGHLGLPNSLIDFRKIKEDIAKRTGALHVMLKNFSVPVEYAVAAGMEAQAPRQERERRIIEDLIMRDNRYKARATEIAEVVIESKRMVLSDESPEKILELIQNKLESKEGEKTGAMNALERNALAK